MSKLLYLPTICTFCVALLIVFIPSSGLPHLDLASGSPNKGKLFHEAMSVAATSFLWLPQISVELYKMFGQTLAQRKLLTALDTEMEH